MTNLKERIRLADFGGGLMTFLFEPNTVATRHLMEERIKNALKKWEPRILVESVRVQEDPEDREAAIATVNYKLVATQAHERVTLSISLTA